MHDLITGRDLNMIAPNDTPFATTTGDGVTACDPTNFDCDYSGADLARQPFPGLGDYMASYGNFGHGRSDALQLEGRRRFSPGFEFNATYMLIQQKATAVDSANATLGGTAYNQFKPENDYSIDSFVPRQRFIAYSIYEVPVGHGRKYGSNMPQVAGYGRRADGRRRGNGSSSRAPDSRRTGSATIAVRPRPAISAARSWMRSATSTATRTGRSCREIR